MTEGKNGGGGGHLQPSSSNEGTSQREEKCAYPVASSNLILTGSMV